MATITKYILNGIERNPPKEWRGVEILATFTEENEQDGTIKDSVQANVTTNEFSFVLEAKAAIDDWFSVYPTEGMPIEIGISNETTTYGAFTGFLDFRTLEYLSDVELKCSIKKDNGFATLGTRLAGISMELLQQKNIINTSDFIHIPYIVENRKTELEKVSLVVQAFIIIKTGVDEVFKIINIASDITSAGVVQAIVNLTTTVINLIFLIQTLVNVLEQIQESYFSPIRYHKGITLYTAIEKALYYCGYSLDCGTFASLLQGIGLCPSKHDEIGLTSMISPASGILKPQDFGYVASDLFVLANQLAFTKVAVIGNTVFLRPFNDPFWIQNSTYVMPSVKVEQAFVKNGSRSINYDELMSSRILQYTTDDSDLWTLTTVADQISVTTVTPINVIEQKRVLLTGSEQITIPYALGVRKDLVDDLWDLFIGTAGQLQDIKQGIENNFSTVANILTESFPVLGSFIALANQRDGVMKVENHFFSLPKIVYLDTTTNRIPSNYTDIVGAIALSNNYHSYKSFVPGVRNPLDLSDTNCKDVYTGVTIPMGINDFNTLTVNSFFTDENGNIGKFTGIKWLPDFDKAICDYWIQGTWATNIEETTV